MCVTFTFYWYTCFTKWAREFKVARKKNHTTLLRSTQSISTVDHRSSDRLVCVHKQWTSEALDQEQGRRWKLTFILVWGRKFIYCAVVSKNGFCWTDFFTSIFVHILVFCLVTSSFVLFFVFKQSKNISVMVCIVVSLRVFHKALKEKKKFIAPSSICVMPDT